MPTITEQTMQTQPCAHANKAYGPTANGRRVWICRDCGQQGNEPDDKYSADYYTVLIEHFRHGTLKGAEDTE